MIKYNVILNTIWTWQWRVKDMKLRRTCSPHYNDVMRGTIASQITSIAIVYSTVYSDADQRKHQSSASLAFMRGIHRGAVNSPHKWPVTRKMFPFDDVIMHTYAFHKHTRLEHHMKHGWSSCFNRRRRRPHFPMIILRMKFIWTEIREVNECHNYLHELRIKCIWTSWEIPMKFFWIPRCMLF